MSNTEALITDARLLAQTGQGRRARESAGVSIDELAAAVGVSPLQLVAWELGDLEPDGPAASDWVHVVRALSHHRAPLSPA